jgi:molybdopterin-biosynthesis enzyme MoeA-like protein
VSLALSRADRYHDWRAGPTVDDVTRQAVADGPVFRPELVEAIEAQARSFGMKMTENNIHQAYIPEGRHH